MIDCFLIPIVIATFLPRQRPVDRRRTSCVIISPHASTRHSSRLWAFITHESGECLPDSIPRDSISASCTTCVGAWFVGDSERTIDSTSGVRQGQLFPLLPRDAVPSEHRTRSIVYRLCWSHSRDFVCSFSFISLMSLVHRHLSALLLLAIPVPFLRVPFPVGASACRDAVLVPLQVKSRPETATGRDAPVSLLLLFRRSTSSYFPGLLSR